MSGRDGSKDGEASGGMDSGLWNLAVNGQGQLVLGGCDVVALARAYGTPLHVVDGQAVRAGYRSFRDAFRGSYPSTRVFYSYKSNCIPGVLRILHAEGCGAEVASPYELWLAARLGVPGADLIYNGAGRSAAELGAAVEMGVGLINVDSVEEAQRLSRVAEQLGRAVQVGIRVDPGVGWKAHFGVRAQKGSIITVGRAIKEMEPLELSAVHVHIGTGLRGLSEYGRALGRVCELIRELRDTLDIVIEDLDLGGGFGVPTARSLTTRELALYRLLGRPPRTPRVDVCASHEEFGEGLAAVLRRECRRLTIQEPRLLLEPGRALTSSAQMLLVTVTDVKRKGRGPLFAVVDGGMQNIAFPLSYEYHHCLVANKALRARGPRYTIAGPLCSSEDILYRNWRLPELMPGDVLAIMDAGAYFTSFANNFSYPRPPVALVWEGESRLVRERETFEQMTATDELQAAPVGPG
jgi:diaminopimelate decarboxylase